MTKRFLLMLTVFAFLLVGLTATGCVSSFSSAPTAEPADSSQEDEDDEEDGVG